MSCRAGRSWHLQDSTSPWGTSPGQTIPRGSRTPTRYSFHRSENRPADRCCLKGKNAPLGIGRRFPVLGSWHSPGSKIPPDMATPPHWTSTWGSNTPSPSPRSRCSFHRSENRPADRCCLKGKNAPLGIGRWTSEQALRGPPGSSIPAGTASPRRKRMSFRNNVLGACLHSRCRRPPSAPRCYLQIPPADNTCLRGTKFHSHAVLRRDC